jgi:hypothetical protein
MATIQVKAAAGIKIAKENEPRNHIPDDDFILVEDSHYYRKAIADGDIELKADEPAKSGAKAGAK